MKKFILLSVYASFALSAGFINPLPISSKATENGGTLSAIDAYQDGVGAMVVQNGRGIDNSAMNALVFKYGNEAKSNSFTVGDQVLLTGSPEDKLLAGKLYPDGGTCSDGSNLTQGETWLNGACQGGSIPNGTQCDDTFSNTINDLYTNGICSGTLVPNGTTCSDGNSATSGETWLNGVCQGGIVGNVAGNGLIYDNCEGGARDWNAATNYCSSKGAGWRLPTYYETSYHLGSNGVPQCSSTTWSWTSTSFGVYYYVWSAISYDTGFIVSTNGVRCVK